MSPEDVLPLQAGLRGAEERLRRTCRMVDYEWAILGTDWRRGLIDLVPDSGGPMKSMRPGTLMIVLLCVVSCAGSLGPPKDEVLRRRFLTNLQDFEELRGAFVSLPHQYLSIGNEAVRGQTDEMAHSVCFSKQEDGRWREHDSRDRVGLDEVLRTLRLSLDEYSRLTALLRRTGALEVHKTRQQAGTEVEIWLHVSGVFGMGKAIAFLDHEPGGNVVEVTDDLGSWKHRAYARLGPPGWFILAVR